MRQVFSGLLTIAVAIGMAQANTYGGILLQDSFDLGNTAGSLPVGWGSIGWATTEDPETSARIDNTVAASPSNSVHFVDNTRSGWARLVREFPATSAATLEFKMRTHDANAWGVMGDLLGNKDSSQTNFYGINFRSNGMIGVQDKWEGLADLLPYEIDTWYTARISIDLSTHKLSFYVEKTGDPLRSGSYNLISNSLTDDYLDRVLLSSPTNYSTDGYFDDIIVRDTVPEPSTLIIWSLLGGLGVAVAHWRRKRAA